MMSNNVVTKLLVTLFILWTQPNFSIGEGSEGDDDAFGDNSLDTLEDQSGIDWFWETMVVMRWDIDDQPLVQYNDLQFDIDFSVSDFIQADQHVRFTIYQDAKCTDPDNIITDSDGYMNSWITEDDTPLGQGLDKDSRRTVTVSNRLIAETITQSKSYTEASPETGVDASIMYCVRFSLWNNGPWDSEATEINHVTITIVLNLVLTDDTVSISGKNIGALDGGVAASDDNFFVVSFICDKDGNPIADVTPFGQGQMVRICVQPTKQALEAGCRMKGIDTFMFSQGAISQPAILNGTAATNQLTVLYCDEGSPQCAFETMLFAYFYQHQQGTILGSGGATLQWVGEGADATLQWGDEGKDRRLQIYFESIPPYVENVDDVKFDESEESERLLEDRTSIKIMAVPDFTILAETGNRPPLLDKSMAMTQKIVLVSLVFIFSVVLILPSVYFFFLRDSPEATPTSKRDLAHPENEPFENVDRWVVIEIPEDQTISSKIPDDRTIVSVKSLFSRASNGSKGSKSLNGLHGYTTEQKM